MIKLLFIVIVTSCLSSFAEDEQIVVKARQTSEAVQISIVNMSDKIIIIGDPEKAGSSIWFESDKKKGNLSEQHMIIHAWKHLIVLTPKKENKPHLWTHDFNVNADFNAVGAINKMNIRIFFSTADNFDINKLGPLEHLDLNVEILPSDLPAAEAD